MVIILLLFVLSVAFFNGANDVSKGVATLHGSGLCSTRSALRWGTLWTAVGGLTAILIATGLLKVFSNGILSADLPLTTHFSIAVAAGISGWVFLATRIGMPVSTTHSIVGALCGPVLLALDQSKILWVSLGHKVLLPLLVSPVIALLLTFFIYRGGYRLFARLSRYCICLERKGELCYDQTVEGALALSNESVDTTIDVGRIERCEENLSTPIRSNANDVAHWISSALISFARGLNDTPKIVAIMFVSTAFVARDVTIITLLAVCAMGLGGYLKGLRVTETLSERVTDMDRNDSVIANLVTALLVVFASKFGVPVSTTHVSSSSIIGIGLRRDGGGINRRVVYEMLLAWVVTMPAAGIISGVVYLCLTWVV
ncbi:MAG: anion permease [Thermodesulfobacteriota bacterium]